MKWALVAVVALSTTAGDVLQSAAMKRHGEVKDFRPRAMARSLRILVREPRMLAAIAAYAVSFFAFLRLLSVAQISFAVPATAVSYVLETILARYLLKERVTWKRWAGALMVACGVALLSL